MTETAMVAAQEKMTTAVERDIMKVTGMTIHAANEGIKHYATSMMVG